MYIWVGGFVGDFAGARVIREETLVMFGMKTSPETAEDKEMLLFISTIRTADYAVILINPISIPTRNLPHGGVSHPTKS